MYDINTSVVNVAHMQQNNICQANVKFQNDATSSIANNIPPTGAPNADAIPAPAPAEMKSLRPCMLRNRLMILV